MGVVDDVSSVSGSVTISVQAFQRGTIGGRGGTYNADQQLLTHACSVLRAGGVDVPTGGSAQKAWLESQGGN